ncbi:MAG: type II secretion system protein [Bacilli bacterium]
MKKRNGFTLVEILVVIGILLTVSVAGIVSFNVISKKSKERVENKAVERLKAATEVYFSEFEYPKIKEDIYNEQMGYVIYNVSDLINKGILKEDDIKDTKIKSNDTIKVSLGNNKNIEISYPGEKESYLVKPSIVYVESSTVTFNSEWYLSKVSIYNENKEKIDINTCNNCITYKSEINSTNEKVVGSYNVTYSFNKKNYVMKVVITPQQDNVSGSYPDYSGKEEEITVATDGVYTFVVSGSQGATGGGLGGEVTADISLKKGDKLKYFIGGIEGKNGGGKGESNGGDSTTIKVNEVLYIAAAGGGGGNGGTHGGNGDSSGGSSNCSTGVRGSNYSGGSSSSVCSYSCNCSTCGGGCASYSTYDCNCDTCGGGCQYYYDIYCEVWGAGPSPGCGVSCSSCCCHRYSNCNGWCPTCAQYYPTYSCNCSTCSSCDSYYSTYDCNCGTCPSPSASGNGGSNYINNSKVTNVNNQSGRNNGTGKIQITLKK